MPTREHSHWAEKKSIAWSQKTISSYDGVVISTNHQAFDLQELADWADLIVDTRNAMTAIEGAATVIKA